MNDRNSEVLVFVTIITAPSLLSGCATTPLKWAVRTGNVSKVEKQIDEGADVDERYRVFGETALHLAALGGNLQIVTLLIEAGANIDAIGYSYTPLMIAAEAGDVEMVRLLIKSGANVNISNYYENDELFKPNTALMAASSNGHSEVAQLLIEAGADVHYRDNKGDTALEWTLSWGGTLESDDHRKMLETAVILVQAGADGPRALRLVRSDLYLKDELTKLLHESGAADPRRFAISGDYSEIADYLKDWKSREPVPDE